MPRRSAVLAIPATLRDRIPAVDVIAQRPLRIGVAGLLLRAEAIAEL